jgi:hypothetical protein
MSRNFCCKLFAISRAAKNLNDRDKETPDFCAGGRKRQRSRLRCANLKKRLTRLKAHRTDFDRESRYCEFCSQQHLASQAFLKPTALDP